MNYEKQMIVTIEYKFNILKNIKTEIFLKKYKKWMLCINKCINRINVKFKILKNIKNEL